MSLTTLHGSSRHLTMMCARAVIVFGFSWFAVFAGLWTGFGAANAHEQRPSIVTLTFENSGRYRLAIDTNLEALLAQIGPE
ncbi:MAG: hypothetical protein AAFO68_11580, partial [Pseudomonadota bacterium]